MSNPRVIKVDIKIAPEKLFRGLEQLRRNLDKRDAMLDELGQVLAASTRQRFRTSTAPDGSKWKALNPKTLKRKKNKKILVESTELVGSIHHEVQGDTVTIGTNVKYAGVHQFGETVQVPARQGSSKVGTKGKNKGRFMKASSKAKHAIVKTYTVPAHERSFPARPFLGLSKSDEKQVVDIVKKHVARAVEDSFKA